MLYVYSLVGTLAFVGTTLAYEPKPQVQPKMVTYTSLQAHEMHVQAITAQCKWQPVITNQVINMLTQDVTALDPRDCKDV